MAAEVDFDLGREPAEAKAVPGRDQESSLREVHLPRHLLHPLIIPGPVEEVDGGRGSSEGLGGKGVYVIDIEGHADFIFISSALYPSPAQPCGSSRFRIRSVMATVKIPLVRAPILWEVIPETSAS